MIWGFFFPENLEKVTARLTDLCLDLFHKMIDSSKPFHLTLINVCVTKFLDPQDKTGIGAFMKPKEEKWKEPEISKKNRTAGEENIDSEIPIKSPSRTTIKSFLTGKQNAHADKTDFKVSTVTSETRNFKDRTTDEETSSETDTQHSISVEKTEDGTRKRKTVESSIKPSCSRTFEVENTASSVPELPAGVDMETFKELPIDIQQEILNSKHVINCDMNSNTERICDNVDSRQAENPQDFKTGLDKDGSFGVGASTEESYPRGKFASIYKIEANTSVDVGKCDDKVSLQFENSNNSRTEVDGCFSIGNDNEIASMQSENLVRTSKTPERNLDDSSSGQGHTSSELSDRRTQFDACMSTPSKLPSGIDPTVFSQLPPDVQKSVLAEHHAQKVQKEFAEMKTLQSPPNKKAKRNGKMQANISNFFTKKS